MTDDLLTIADPSNRRTLEDIPGATPGTPAHRGTPTLTHHARERCQQMGISTKVINRIWHTHTMMAPAAPPAADSRKQEQALFVYSPEHPDYLLVIPERDRHKQSPTAVTIVFNTTDKYVRVGDAYRTVTPAQFHRLRRAQRRAEREGTTPPSAETLVPPPPALHEVTAHLHPLRVPASLNKAPTAWAREIIRTLGAAHGVHLLDDDTTLWRIDYPKGRPTITVRTAHPSIDLTRLAENDLVKSVSAPRDVYTSHTLRAGSRHGFTLRANPLNATRTGKADPIRDREGMIDWLEQQGVGGFTIPTHRLLLTPDVTAVRGDTIYSHDGRPLFLAEYTGTLVIKDTEEFKHLLAEGLGHPLARKSGVAMLTLTPHHEKGRN